MKPGLILLLLLCSAFIAGILLHKQREEKVAQLAKDKQSEDSSAAKPTLDPNKIHIPIQLLKKVEKKMGRKFSRPVEAYKADLDRREEAEEYRWIKHFGQPALDNRQYAFELIGILPANAPAYVNEIAQLMGKEDGLYDASSHEILLSDSLDYRKLEYLTTLHRLLIIALIEQNTPADKKLTDDAFITRDSMIQARAQVIHQRLVPTAADNTATNNTDNSPPSLTPVVPDTFSSLAKNIYQFKYTQAIPYCEQSNNDQETQNTVAHDFYSQIPRTSSTLYKRNPLPLTLQPSPNEKPTTNEPPILTPNERLLINTSLGQVTMQAFISRISKQNLQLHHKLKNDRLTFIQQLDQPDAPILTWDLTWHSVDAAQLFSELYNAKNFRCSATQTENRVIIQLK